MGLYYRIWVDCIIRMKSIETNRNDWKLKCLIAMSIPMTFNFVLLMVILQKNILDYYVYEINIPSLSGFENYIITMLVLYLLPIVVINYMLIFHRNRYEKILSKYKYNNGKLALTYILSSMFLPIVLIWLSIILK